MNDILVEKNIKPQKTTKPQNRSNNNNNTIKNMYIVYIDCDQSEVENGPPLQTGL